MKRLLRLAGRLYPRAWRDRYGEEFDALIEDMTPRWRYVVNIVVGALIMQLSRLALVPVALAVAGALAGAAVSLAMPPVYASSTWVLVQVPGTAEDAGERGQRIRTAIDAVLQTTALDRKAVSVSQRGEPGQDPVLLEVSASAGSAPAAQQAAARAMGSIIEANFASGNLDRTSGVQFRALQPPNLPRAPQHNTPTRSAVGGGLGLFAGVFVALAARRLRRPTA